MLVVISNAEINATNAGGVATRLTERANVGETTAIWFGVTRCLPQIMPKLICPHFIALEIPGGATVKLNGKGMIAMNLTQNVRVIFPKSGTS